MPIEIEVAAGAETLGTEDGVDHPDELGALVVDGGGVEVGDLDIGIGPHRVGERPGILGELGGAKHAHVLDPLDRARAHVGAELLVAEDREPFLQRQLEPVAAGDAVARPVVEIFVRDDAGDGVVIGVGGGIRVGEDVARVEDVEALVLHRAEIEIGDGDDVEHGEVIFPAEHLLVPFHRRLQ